MVRVQCLVERKGRSAHPERPEHLVAHDVVVALSELSVRLDRARADVAGGRGERIAVLEERAEFRRGLHGRQHVELPLRRRAVEGEEPLEVLAGQARARADQVLHADASGDFGVPDLEARVDLRHRRVPAEAALVDEPGEQERGERLGIRRDDVEAVGGDGLGPAALANAEALFDERRVLVEEHDRDAGHVGGFAHPVGERLQVSHARRVQRPGRSAPVRFADVAGGTQAVVHEPDLGAASLDGREGAVDEDDHRERVLPRDERRHPARFFGRGLVPGPAEQVPALAARRVGGGELLSVEAGVPARPGRGDGRTHSRGRLDLHELDLQLLLGILEDEAVGRRRHRPVGGDLERGSRRERHRAVNPRALRRCGSGDLGRRRLRSHGAGGRRSAP